MKKLIGITLLSLIVLTGCGTGENTNIEPVIENNDKVEVAEQLEKDIDVKINSITTTEDDEWDELEDGKELIVVNITLKNNKTEEYEFNPNYVQLMVDGGAYTETDLNPKGTKSIGSKLVAPSEEISGIVVFELEKDKEYEGIVYDDFNIKIDFR